MTQKRTRHQADPVVLYTEYAHQTATIGLLFDPDNDAAWIESDCTVTVES
ncbi:MULTISPECIES: hypothetical protein [Halorussus]|nr:hypothetical protein [Halorussus vallis]USZ77082.1 hypothetical protein NGM07_07085 [Halorussus vallis]